MAKSGSLRAISEARDRMPETAGWWRTLESDYALSPIHRALGLSLRVADRGSVEIHYDGSPGANNLRNTVSGSALTAMIDSAVMQGVRTLLGEREQLTTVELKVNFLRPASSGTRLVATSDIARIGRRTCVGFGRVRDDSDQTIAIGIVTCARLPTAEDT
jgi:uncharacterized protein (TIGR00369 family)